ncbi:MAG: hypothetical protein NT166_28835 [Candidatus Aminicenantes bacterium]|nr:hypothetical protein [Candidatus Aminicenantes bacterium]
MPDLAIKGDETLPGQKNIDAICQIDWEFLEKVVLLARNCFENTRYKEVYRLHNTWDNHVANILGYIADFCFTTDLNLNKHEWTIIFAAAILHDIGKSLPYFHPAINEKKIHDDAFVLKNLEDAHHIISFFVLKNLVDKKPLKNLIKGNENQKKCCAQLNRFIKNFQGKIEKSSSEEDWQKYLQCAAWIALRHKTLNEKLLYVFDSYLPIKTGNTGSKENEEKDRITSLESDVKGNDEIKEINKGINEWINKKKFKLRNVGDIPDRFSILSALLQLGDKLDITKDRIREDRLYLEVLLDDMEEKKFRQEINTQKKYIIGPQSLIRWFQYYYVSGIEIKKQFTNNNNNEKEPDITQKQCSNKQETGINITIHYRYPECLRDDFLFIRLQLEKDFEDLGIISVLESALQEQKHDEDYRVTIQRIENIKEDNDGNKKTQRIIGLQRRGERLVYCLEKVWKSVGHDPKDDEYIKKKFQGCLELTDKKAAPILSCMKGVKSKTFSPENCDLFKCAEKIFQKDDGKASHPDWEQYSIKLKENICYLLCHDKRNSETVNKDVFGKIEKYLNILTNKDEEYNVMLSLSPQARVGLNEWKDEVAKESKKAQQGKLFYPPDSKTRFIPVSLDVAILLNLFRHLRDESLTVEDISNISGLDRGRILKYCGWLEHEQYLLLDDKAETYKINLDPAKYSIVERVLKDFDSQRSEMVSKIRDIARFGKPLALYSDLPQKSLKTRIGKLDSIFAPFNKDKEMEGLPLRKSILLLGPPGSGKTTLALDIVRQVRLQRLPEEIALYLTFSGDIQRLADDFKPLGWEYHDIAACVRSLSTLQGKTYLNDPDKFFKHLLNILDEFSPDLVAIDNLGYFLRLVPLEFCREIFNRLIKVLTVRGITSILIGDDIPNGIGFECFDTDGVICLHYKDGKREFEITKMRGREFAGGRHPFKIKNLSEKLKNLSKEDKRKFEKRDEPVIEIFPNIQMHLEVAQRNKGKKGNDKIGDPLNSGINGLDELLPIYSEKENKKYGFEQGEIILVLGSPGVGKTVSGLHFLAEGYNMGGKKDKKQETVLWVSFESDLEGLYLATRSFSKEAKVKQFYEKMGENKDEMFRFFPPAQLNPDELVNFLLDACKGEEECIVEENENKKTEPKKLQRLVLDSVNDIEQAFPTDMAFRSFMTSLVQLLREKGVTVMFLYRTRNFFGKAEDIGRTLASVVDTIICLKVLEIQNAVQKGLFLLKVRGREHRSKLLAINFKDDEGMSVLDSGWTMSGLISGEAGEIKEPRVSVKLFFENRNEFLINALIVNEYNRRFKGGHTNFVHVRKPQIYSEFWSFKGSSGAGHSNVRVLSLCDYWAVHFQREDKLYDLFEYVSATTYQLVHRDEFWRRCAVYSFKKNAFEIFSIPNYVDVGVLAFHKKLKGLSEFWDAVKPGADNNWDNLDTRGRLAQLTWNDLDPIKNPKIMKAIEKISGNKYSPLRYLFTMPSLESKASFVSFFLELYWSFGGVIFDLRKLFFEYARECSNSLLKGKTEDVIKVEDILFFKTQAIELKGNMAFIAEILMLIPERILNNAIRSMNAVSPNFIGDICRHGEVALEKFLREKAVSQGEKTFLSQIEKRSGISNIDDPLDAFFGIYPNDIQGEKIEIPIIVFIDKLINELTDDEIWKKEDGVAVGQGATLDDLIIALKDTKKSVSDVISGGNEKNDEKKFVLIILYFVVSRIITNRERYQKLLEWRYKGKKTKDDREHLVEIIQIGHNNSAAKETLKFLFQLVNNGIAPNPHYGNFNDQTYLARKWSGDVAPRPKLPESKDIFGPLDLNMPPDAYEYKQNEKEKTNYRIAPLPSYEQNKKRSSCAVMGLWSLGITKPALSPEIGWIFIDALTEDRFIRLRARKGLGLPAKVSVYQRESLQKDQPDIYGSQDADGNPVKGIIHYYDLATQDKAQEKPAKKEDIHRRTRERASIPYYYQIEEFLIKELGRFFEPSFFAILKGKEGNDEEKKKEERQKLIEDVLQRIHNRIKNFLIKEFKLAEEPDPAESQQNKKTLD